uniref:Putative ovule protein n=1 Tax=Solanum chacoense TaxID=4108 RepID=A0A0V0GWW1_SOLCH
MFLLCCNSLCSFYFLPNFLKIFTNVHTELNFCGLILYLTCSVSTRRACIDKYMPLHGCLFIPYLTCQYKYMPLHDCLLLSLLAELLLLA